MMGKDLKGKELGVGLSQRADGRYEARAKINGIQVRLYDFNLSKLKHKFEKAKDSAAQEKTICAKDTKLTDWFNEWFELYKKPSLKPTGVAAYRRKFVNTYGVLLADQDINDITQPMIQKATNDLIDKGYAAKTVRDALSVLDMLFETAFRMNIIGSNPCWGINVAKTTTVEERRVLTHDEQKMFLELVDNSHYKELYSFMLLTGVRVGEMGALQWEDIDFENEFINIKHSLHCSYNDGVKTLILSSPKTITSYRKIPFFGETKNILLSQKKKQDELKKILGNRYRTEMNLVFTSSLGSPVTRYVLEHDLKMISKQLQLISACEGNKIFKPIYPHALRHTFATRCFEKGMSAPMVQRIMGHSNIQMTMSYTHILDEKMKKEANNVGYFLE